LFSAEIVFGQKLVHFWRKMKKNRKRKIRKWPKPPKIDIFGAKNEKETEF